MNIKLVRLIDYYIGIPACFLLSFINKFIPKKFFSPKDNINCILFIELSEMGSTILAYSAMKTLQQKFPKAKLYFLIFKRNKESVELLNIIDKKNILTIRDDNPISFLIDVIKLTFKFPSLKLDITYDLELFSRFSVILTFLSRATAKVGFHKYTAEGLYRGSLLTHNVHYNTHTHMVHNFLALADSIFEDQKNIPILKKSINDYTIHLPIFKFNEKLLTDFKKNLPSKNKTLVINSHAGNLLPIRNWGIKNFSKIIQELINAHDLNIILIGLKDARKDAEYILSHVKQNKNIVNLIGKTKNIYELIHVIQIGDAFLTNDSGPAHFASLTNTTIFTLFGPETPDLYGPLSKNSIPIYNHFLCSPCLTARNHRNTHCQNNQCLQSITPHRVINSIKQKIIL